MLAALLEMATSKPEELVKIAKGFNRLEELAKSAQDQYRESHQENGKVIHVLKSEWISNREKAGAKILTSATYPEHHEAVTGGKPTRRGYQCAVTFGLLVVSGKLITEQDYDDCPCELITLASEIIGKANNDADHDAVKEAAEILRRRPKSGIKDLKAIKARFIEKTEGEGDDEKKVTEFVSQDEADKLVKKATQLDVAQTLGDLLVAGQLPAIIANILVHARTTEKEEDVRAMVHGAINLRPALEANVDPKNANARRFSDEKLEALRNEIVPPVQKDRAWYEATFKAAYAQMQEISQMFAEVGKPELPTEWSDQVDKELATATAPEPDAEAVPAEG